MLELHIAGPKALWAKDSSAEADQAAEKNAPKSSDELRARLGARRMLSSSSGGNISPLAIVTRQRPQIPAPPHPPYRVRPARIPASKSVVPALTTTLFPTG